MYIFVCPEIRGHGRLHGDEALVDILVIFDTVVKP